MGERGSAETLAVLVVEEAGFEVFEAAGSNEASRILESRDDVRPVLTDIDMPGGVTGLCLAATVRDRWPLIEIIVPSGERAPSRAMIPGKRTLLSEAL